MGVKYLENQYPTHFPTTGKWYVLQKIFNRMENLCSRIGFYSMIVAIILYIDCRVVFVRLYPNGIIM